MQEETPDPTGRRDPVGDLLIGLILAALALFVVVEAWRMPLRGPLGLATSPGFVPLLAGGLALVLCAALVAINVQRGGLRGIGAWLRTAVMHDESLRLVVLIALITLYVLALGPLPFLLATFLFLLAILAYLRAARWWLIPIYAALVAWLVATALPWLFEMPVP
jgi:hypothetical protein